MYGSGDFPVGLVWCLVAIIERGDSRSKAKDELSCVNTKFKPGLARVLECSGMPRLSDSSLQSNGGLLDMPLLVSPYTDLPHLASVLLTCIQTWPGLLLRTTTKSSHQTPLQSLVDTLYLANYKARTAILDLLYSSFHPEVPDWTDEFEVAMRTADPCTARKEWRLSSEGLVSRLPRNGTYCRC